MSVSYTTLFTRLGKIFKWANLWLTYQGTSLLGAAPSGAADDILSQYEARRDLVPNLEANIAGFSGSVAGWVGTLKGAADKTISDLQQVLNAPSSSASVILPLLAAQMVVDSQTIQANTGISASSAAGGSNHGSGLLILSVKNAAGVTDERIIPESVVVKCVADQYVGTAAGAEIFSITGYPKSSSPNVSATRGNGTGPNLTVADAGNLIPNGNFETFTVANTPDSWTIANGTVGTHIFKDTTAGQFHCGLASLKLVGDGSQATIKLTQNISSLVRASTIYGVSVWLRKNGTVTGGSALAVSITGTGFSTVNLFSADPTTLTTSFVNFTAFIDIGTIVPSDLTLNVSWTTANAAGASAVVLVDDVVMARPTAFGNVQYMLVRGATDFSVGDVFTVTTANSLNGVFQTAFARWYNQQLPSTGGTPTQLDSLAT